MDTNRKVNEQDLGGVREGINCNQNIFYEKKSIFSESKIQRTKKKKRMNDRTSQGQKQYFKLLKRY